MSRTFPVLWREYVRRPSPLAEFPGHQRLHVPSDNAREQDVKYDPSERHRRRADLVVPSYLCAAAGPLHVNDMTMNYVYERAKIMFMREVMAIRIS
jgi:hypothetical protein